MLDRAVSVAVLTADCDTDAVEVIDASGDKEALGEPDIVNVIVVVATAVSVTAAGGLPLAVPVPAE